MPVDRRLHRRKHPEDGGNDICDGEVEDRVVVRTLEASGACERHENQNVRHNGSDENDAYYRRQGVAYRGVFVVA